MYSLLIIITATIRFEESEIQNCEETIVVQKSVINSGEEENIL